MKKPSLKKGLLAIVLAVVIILSLITVITPSANSERIQTDMLTPLAAQNWVNPSVYENGIAMTSVRLNGETVNESFDFSLGDEISFDVPSELTGEYRVGLLYRTLSAKPTEMLLDFSYHDAEYTALLPLLWYDAIGDDGRYSTDRMGNELANLQTVYPENAFNPLLDNRSINKDEIMINASGGSATMINQTQTIIVSKIVLYQSKRAVSYQEYLSLHQNEKKGEDVITIEGEDYALKSDSSIRSSNIDNLQLTPYNTYKRLINNLDGGSFGNAGQKVIWEFEIEKEGFYEIGFAFSQNSAPNKKVYRTLELDGEVPFEEAFNLSFKQTRNNSFETAFLQDEGKNNYSFYLSRGRHTLALKATLSPVKSIYNNLLSLTSDMNTLGMDITKLTAGASDQNRTWDMDTYLPNAVEDIKGYIERLQSIYEELKKIEGETPTYANDLLYAKEVLQKLLSKPRTIPNHMEMFNTGDNSAIKHINTVISSITSLNLGIDQIYVKGVGQIFSPKKVSIFQVISDGLKKFVYSYSPAVSKSAGVTQKNDNAVTVWMSRSSIYVQMLQNLTDSAQELSDVKINLSIMPSEQKLILATAAGTNPDIALGVAEQTPFKFALRGAAKNLCDYPDFLSFYNSEYNLEALVPCVYGDGVYGATETQDYYVLFYRTDILDALDIEIPKTWDDVKSIMPTLLRYNKNFRLPIASFAGIKPFSSTTPYIYQNGGELYTEDGSGAALLENNTIDGFRDLTDLFKIYAVDEYIMSFYNSFRTGDTPIGIAGISHYIQMKQAAPELSGLWGIAPVPGVLKADGSIARNMNLATTSCMIFQNTKKSQEAWRFLKWWLSADTQSRFGNIMELSYGPEYKWNTANRIAFEQSSYPESDKEIMRITWDAEQETVRHPASYIVERELSNAFTNVVVNGDTVIEALEKSTLVSNREIIRKLKEFGYCDENGNLIQEYPIKALQMLKEKLKESERMTGS